MLVEGCVLGWIMRVQEMGGLIATCSPQALPCCSGSGAPVRARMAPHRTRRRPALAPPCTGVEHRALLDLSSRRTRAPLRLEPSVCSTPPTPAERNPLPDQRPIPLPASSTMAGLIIAFWSALDMSWGRLLFAGASTRLYPHCPAIEERDRLSFFGGGAATTRPASPCSFLDRGATRQDQRHE